MASPISLSSSLKYSLVTFYHARDRRIFFAAHTRKSILIFNQDLVLVQNFTLNESIMLDDIISCIAVCPVTNNLAVAIKHTVLTFTADASDVGWNIAFPSHRFVLSVSDVGDCTNCVLALSFFQRPSETSNYCS